MARTAVVNRARRMPRNSDGSFKKRTRAGRAANPRRRRRSSHHRRRRNPSTPESRNSPYASIGYYRSPNRARRRSSGGSRRRNPDFSLNELTSVVPAATGGVWAARWAVKQSGAWEADGPGGALVPGIKQALAIYLAATFGGDMLGQLLGSDEKGRIAKIAALGYGGDLFLRARFMRDSQFVQQNLSLQGMEQQSAIGATGTGDSYVDASGNTWVSTSQGWQLAGVGDDDGAYVLVSDNQAQLAGMEAGSAIGGFSNRRGRRHNASSASSFGYA